MKLIYIASPYTHGSQAENVAAQMRAASALIDKGHAPHAPLLSHFLEMYHPRRYGAWLSVDMEFLKRSDALLRLPGESHGADLEVAAARQLGLPIYHTIDDVPNGN